MCPAADRHMRRRGEREYAPRHLMGGKRNVRQRLVFRGDGIAGDHHGPGGRGRITAPGTSANEPGDACTVREQRARLYRSASERGTLDAVEGAAAAGLL